MPLTILISAWAKRDSISGYTLRFALEQHRISNGTAYKRHKADIEKLASIAVNSIAINVTCMISKQIARRNIEVKG